MLLHDSEDRRQAEPRTRSLALRREEWLEDMGHDLPRNAAARVAEDERRVVSGPHVGRRRGRPGFECLVACLDDHRAAARHGILGVDGEVHQDLLDLRTVGADGPQVGGPAEADIDVLADRAAQDAAEFPDDGIQVRDLHLQHLFPAEGKELGDEVPGPLAGREDLRRQLRGLHRGEIG